MSEEVNDLLVVCEGASLWCEEVKGVSSSKRRRVLLLRRRKRMGVSPCIDRAANQLPADLPPTCTAQPSYPAAASEGGLVFRVQICPLEMKQ